MSDHFFKTFAETQSWLDKMGIKSYTINPTDLTVDVNANVDISINSLECIPVRFGVIYGDFNCGHNLLTSLNGAPVECEDFLCHDNHLASLVGSPLRRCHIFNCSDNQITSLEGLPDECLELQCNNNQLTSLDGVPKCCLVVGCSGNPALTDVSGLSDECELYYERHTVSKNQAKKQLADMAAGNGDQVLSAKHGRTL